MKKSAITSGTTQYIDFLSLLNALFARSPSQIFSVLTNFQPTQLTDDARRSKLEIKSTHTILDVHILPFYLSLSIHTKRLKSVDKNRLEMINDRKEGIGRVWSRSVFTRRQKQMGGGIKWRQTRSRDGSKKKEIGQQSH